MYRLPKACFCFCAIAFVTGRVLVPSSDDASQTAADTNSQDSNGLSMGRGIHMLRLGKRSASLDSDYGNQVAMFRKGRSVDDKDSARLSSNDVQTVLYSIFDQPRDDQRRQPPLPRYGRDSNANGKLPTDIFGDDSGVYASDFLPLSNNRFFFWPPPRGGRYRRSFPGGRIAYQNYFLQDVDHTRSLAFPRFGNSVNDFSSLQPNAVPRPRIGRFQNDQSSNSVQTKTA